MRIVLLLGREDYIQRLIRQENVSMHSFHFEHIENSQNGAGEVCEIREPKGNAESLVVYQADKSLKLKTKCIREEIVSV